MARSPLKLLRFLVWVSTSDDNRVDALTAFDELFEQTAQRFGIVYAHWWSISQALRSLPYGLIVALLKLAATILVYVS